MHFYHKERRGKDRSSGSSSRHCRRYPSPFPLRQFCCLAMTQE